MTQTDKILAHKEAGVGIVTFNNPERHNAVSLEMWEAAKRVLDGFAADPEMRVVVLTGAGGKAFVSGADISKFASERATLEAPAPTASSPTPPFTPSPISPSRLSP